MRATAVRAIARPPSTRYGTYDALPPSSAMTAYPPPRPVPPSIPRPAYVPANLFDAPIWEHAEPAEAAGSAMRGPPRPIALGDEAEVRGVRAAARLARRVLREVGRLVKPGVTTDDLDKAAHELIVRAGAYPSPLGYAAFPRSITTSVNNVIAHGIPDDRPLDARDLVNLDITVYLSGYHGDTSATFLLPRADDGARELAESTAEALSRAVSACGPGVPFAEIGRVVEDLADRRGLSVNRQFTGHGIGRQFHLPPYILHHRNREPGVMAPGDCFTIEPPLVQGTDARGEVWDDGWTVSTVTGARSAQFEHQLLVTRDGVEVLTRDEADEEST